MECLMARREKASNPKEYRRLSQVLTAINDAPDYFDEMKKLEQEKQKLIQPARRGMTASLPLRTARH